MSHTSGNIDDFGMDSGSLSGPLEARLRAVRAAGFTQIMLCAGDLVGHPDGVEAALAAVRASGLRVTGFQGLQDFEGLSGHLHDYKMDVAKSMLELCRALDCRLLLINASTLQPASANPAVLLRDLRKLAMLAIPMNIKIAYQAVARAHTVQDFRQAWDLVCEADRPNLGLALGFDAFRMVTAGCALEELEMLDPDQLFLVQLADFLWDPVNPVAQADDRDAPFRVFPGKAVTAKPWPLL